MADHKLFSNISLLGEQHKVVENIQNNIVVKGESGTGKTTSFLARIAFLQNLQITTPEHILNIVLDEDAKGLAQKMYSTLVDEEVPQFQTMFTLACKIYTYAQTSVVKSIELSEDILKKILLDSTGWHARSDELNAIKDHLAFVKSNEDEVGDEIAIRNITFSQIGKLYEDFKSKKKIYDEHDVMLHAYTLLHENPQILAHFQSLYEFIQVDDAQELTRDEHRLLHILTGEKQCLVMFANTQAMGNAKGAYPSCIHSFDSDYVNSLVMNWQVNFTASKTCVAAANHFLYKDKPEILSKSDVQDDIVCKAFADIQRLYAYAKKQWMGNSEAVFVYRHPAYVLPLLDDAFLEHASFQFQGDLQTVFEDTIVKELYHYIKLLLDCKNTESFQIVYKAMDLDISEKIAREVLALMNDDENMDVFEALMRSSLKMVKKKELSSHMEIVRLLPKKESIFIIKTILRELGYDTRFNLLQTSESDPYLLMLKTFALKYPDPQEFLDRLLYLSQTKMPEEGSIKVVPIEAIRGMSQASIYMIDCIEELSFIPTSTIKKIDIKNQYALCLTHAKHLEFFGFRSVYDVPCNVSEYVMMIHKQDKEDTKQVVRSAKIVRKVSETHLKPNTRIHHETLGSGIIKKVKDGMMQVDFDNGEVKNLNVKHCLSNEMIKLG